MRTVICHYHIFKNSGTSFDELLAASFRGAPVAFDGPFPFSVFSQDELLKVVRHHPAAVAFSSHQVRLPVPVALDVEILPVVFLRHPLLRLRSVYEFQHRRAPGPGRRVLRVLGAGDGAEYTPRDAQRAGQVSFPEWVREALDQERPLGNVSNVQTQLLGGVYGRRALRRARPAAEGGVEADLAQARRNLAAVPLLARTEWFGADVACFEATLAAHGLTFRYRERRPANTTATDLRQPLAARLDGVRGALGEELYGRLERVNAQDLALYRWARDRLDGRPAADDPLH